MTLPDSLAGRDICGRAPTGSGKTIAFGIPLVVRLDGRRSRPKKPRGLVLVPTRELATQVAEELSRIAGTGGPSVHTFFGGVGFGPQLAALRRGVDIAVACPGRLADLVQRGACSLADVGVVVIDEADRMADMGFLPVVRRLLDGVRRDRQTLLFSATLDGDVDVLIGRYQRDPIRHELPVDHDAPGNRHIFWTLPRESRVDVAAGVVNKRSPALLFTRTKRGADRLTKQLASRGVTAAAIHGDRSQAQRERALHAFAASKVQALVATDVAARGIHVDDVAVVVHYDLPATEKDYVHRSGRTGRAGATGVVVSLIDESQRRAGEDLQRRLGFERRLHDADLHALTDTGHDAQRAAKVESRSTEKPRPTAPPRRRPRTTRVDHSDRRRARAGHGSTKQWPPRETSKRGTGRNS